MLVNPKQKQYQKEIPGEVILFKIPTKSCGIFVANLLPSTSVEDLLRHFVPYGPIFDLSDLHPLPGFPQLRYAFVTYYCTFAAAEARKHADNTVLNGLQICVRPKKESSIYSGADLPVRKSIELANHYFGFNQWSSQVLSLSQEDSEAPQPGLFRYTYSAVVRLSFRDGRFIDGYGKISAEEADLAHCLKQAKKLAVTEALKSCFAAVAIIILRTPSPSGGIQQKVTVHLLDRQYTYWVHDTADNTDDTDFDIQGQLANM